MIDRLADQTALITGAASGIGRAIAIRFAEEGANVVVADIREEPREGGRPTHEVVADAEFVETDVSDVDAMRDAVEETVSAFGGLDVLVNNAGIFPGSRPIEAVEEAEYDRVMDVNLKSAYFGSKFAAGEMREQGEGGAIVNISSIAGLVGYDDAASYCASKGAVANLSRELALELGPDDIRVNAINPGVVETAMTTQDTPAAGTMDEQIPLHRDGQPEDIAGAALFLASDDAAYVTGHNLVVDGGYTAK
ncbi:SDR family oxidoreductase [Haloarcula nitratireducens]|uniref:SDR family oxidoreductase n=1 Tax=Haloarcula nitratireducens TaxID=2487749 RepID=A0AAW4PE02_9EURY|nr:SDR family oxidoreductase [Halomicroarcula nitratireducens]MBX0295685.1 SDR family oxidoreductase [Halomicroarcula nitratireducens]